MLATTIFNFGNLNLLAFEVSGLETWHIQIEVECHMCHYCQVSCYDWPNSAVNCVRRSFSFMLCWSFATSFTLVLLQESTKTGNAIGSVLSLEHVLGLIVPHVGQKPCTCPNVYPQSSFSSQILTIPFLWQLFPFLKEVAFFLYHPWFFIFSFIWYMICWKDNRWRGTELFSQPYLLLLNITKCSFSDSYFIYVATLECSSPSCFSC